MSLDLPENTFGVLLDELEEVTKAIEVWVCQGKLFRLW